MRFLISFVLGVIGLSSPPAAQSLQLASDPFNETLRESAEISGALVVGIHIRNKTGATKGFDPKLPTTLENDSLVCVRVMSANGLYDSENEYRFSDTADRPNGPMIDLSQSKHLEFLSSLSDHEIATATALGPCDSTPSRYLVTSWGMGTDPVATLLLNSFQADAAFLRFTDGTAPVRCEPVEVEVATAYDMVCELDLTGRQGQDIQVSIERFVNRQPAPPTAISIALPSQ